MKRIGEFTSRGVVPGSNTRTGKPFRIRLFDGKFTTGHVVKEFRIWSTSYNSDSNADCIGKLSKSPNSTTSPAEFFRADDMNEIAWATSEGASLSGNDAAFAESILDPENLIVEDLYVYARQGDDVDVNYLIVMEKYDISEAHGAMTMAKDRAMDSEGNWVVEP